METVRGKRLRRFERRVCETARARGLLAAGERVLAAVSGGADSVALLHALIALVPEMDVRITVGHVAHGLHAESEAHAAFVRSLCEDLGTPCLVSRGDVRSRVERERLSVEHAAREERYAALQAQARECGATAIATAHTATDRAETVLLNLLRGTGPEGLRGTPARRGNIVRPLIDVTREDVEAYLKEKGARRVEDPTNRERDALRNRVRLDLIPAMERVVGRPVTPVLARLADTVDLEREAVSAAEEILWADALLAAEAHGGCVELSVARLLANGEGAATLVLRHASRRVAGPGEDLGLAQVRQVLRLLASETGRGLQRAGGCVFERDRGVLRVRPGEDSNNGLLEGILKDT